MTDKTPRWLETFLRDAGIRRSLIVHGNVNDLTRNPETLEYEPVINVMCSVLKRKGYDEVAVWDRFSGLQHLSDQALQELRSNSVDRTVPEHMQGEEYPVEDMGPQPAAAGRNRAEQDPREFFSMVFHAMVNPGHRKLAFILDWSHFLFGNANALSEPERLWLMALSKALRNAHRPLTVQSAGAPSNAIVLLCNTIGSIPPSFYQHNPLVKEIVIPLPDRPQREEFLKQHASLFRLEQPLNPSDAKFADYVDMLDGRTFTDLMQMVKHSHQLTERLSFEKLVNLYKYGEYESPWENLRREKLATIKERLGYWVKGQEQAIRKVEQVIKRAYTGLAGVQASKNRRSPKGVLFFVGPTGVGKTELAKALARFLFGDEDACIRFDMSEFNHEHADQRLIGAPPGYVGYGEGGELTNAIKRRPFAVLLFDEIEKAHDRILDKFLQILEDGRLTDSTGQTVYFSETVIIFTSNIGAASVALTDDPELTARQFKEAVRDYFVTQLQRPELLNRLGQNIVPFNFIADDQVLMDIVQTKLAPLREVLREKYRIADFYFADDEKARRTIVDLVDRSNGGRGIVNEIVPSIVDPLAEFLFEAEDDPVMFAGRKIRVIQAGNTPHFHFELE